MNQKWTPFNHLLYSSGYGWNNTCKVITAAESVWADYLQVCIAYLVKSVRVYSNLLRGRVIQRRLNLDTKH